MPAGAAPMMPMISDSRMISSSSPSSLTSVPDGDDLGLHRLFLGGVGDDDPTGGLFDGIDPTDHDPIVQGAKVQGIFSENKRRSAATVVRPGLGARRPYR